jgi:hypothetical protein
MSMFFAHSESFMNQHIHSLKLIHFGGVLKILLLLSSSCHSVNALTLPIMSSAAAAFNKWGDSANTSTLTSQSTNAVTLTSKCHCGQTRLSIELPEDCLSREDFLLQSPSGPTSKLMIDCHCRSCQRYHASAFVSYCMVPQSAVTIQSADKSKPTSMADLASSNLSSYRDICMETGIVERLYCKHCSTKMATRPKAGARYLDQVLINWGPVQDKNVPKDWQKTLCNMRAKSPKMQMTKWQLADRAMWGQAKPNQDGNTPKSMLTTIQGGCACGAARYRIAYPSKEDSVKEFQHCYCRLCRQMSGSPFQSWMPVDQSSWSWLGRPAPLVRTTEHGQRHICSTCASVLTIVYDDQPDCTWPAVGSLDPEGWPKSLEEMNKSVYRVCHICCRYKPAWYMIPNDGLERVREAS